MACHSVNMPYLALKLRDPVAIQAETSGHDGDGYPQWSIINFDFPAISGRPAVKLFWYDGGKRPGKEVIGDMSGLFKAEIEAARKSGSDFFASGCAVVGDQHTLFSPGDYATTRCALSGGAALPEIKWTRSPGHFAEWVRAIRGGEPAMSNFPNYSGRLTEIILLGNLAVWVAAACKGERVEWDAENLKSPNVAGLETVIKPPYRPGYTLDA